MLIDSHCHLDYYTPDERPDILARARENGVGGMVTIGTKLANAQTQLDLADSQPMLWCTVGTHPHHANDEKDFQEQDIIKLTSHPKVIGVGEAGLDYFYDRSPRDVQHEVFRRHIRAAQKTGLPLCIHTRDADDDTLRLLREGRETGDFAFLLHCFSSGRPLAEAAIEMGGYVSFSGILTFPKSQNFRDLAADLPLDRLLVETDSPYLAPVPFRGKRNEPGYVAHTARVLAECKGIDEAALAAHTTENFYRLFAKARQTAAP